MHLLAQLPALYALPRYDFRRNAQSTTSPTGRSSSSATTTRRPETEAPDHQGCNLPLRLCRPSRPDLSRDVRSEPEKRVSAHPVLWRFLALGRLGRAADGAPHWLRDGRALAAAAARCAGRAVAQGRLCAEADAEGRQGLGIIQLDSETQLSGVPPEAWDYRLGNRTALEWVLDQHKEKTPKDPTIRERFNTYRFADHKEKVVDLLKRVTRVSVETVAIIEAMRKLPRG